MNMKEIPNVAAHNSEQLRTQQLPELILGVARTVLIGANSIGVQAIPECVWKRGKQTATAL
eukprot:585316-Amphidinium_carterae.1